MVEETKQAAGIAGALGSLGVDGKLFLAQLLNFGVVLLVMWKWVYTPLLKVMDERSKKIEQGLKDATDAAALRRSADEERDTIVLAARADAKRIVEEAAANADTERVAATARTKTEVERIVTQGKERLAMEKETLMASVRAEAADLVTAVAEKVLREKLDAAADKKLIKDALKDIA